MKYFLMAALLMTITGCPAEPQQQAQDPTAGWPEEVRSSGVSYYYKEGNREIVYFSDYADATNCIRIARLENNGFHIITSYDWEGRLIAYLERIRR